MNGGFLQSGEFYSAVCALLWAVALVLFRRSGEHVGPVALNYFKNVVGLILLVFTMVATGTPFVPPAATANDWLVLAISGFVGIAIADSLFFASLNRLGAGRTAIVDCLYSPFVILCSVLYLNEPMGPLLFVALALMVLAILVGAWVPARANTAAPALARDHKAVLLGILAVFLMAAGIVFAKPVLEASRTGALWATTVRMASGVAFLSVQAQLPRYRAEVRGAFTPNRTMWFTIPGAVVGAYLAILFWILGMKYATSTVASILTQMSNVLVLPLAWLFLGEALTGRKVVAVLLGLAAGALVIL